MLDILLVEDNPADVLMTREALEFHGLQHRLHVVVNGEQALDFLYWRNPYADVPRPNLILLDLNLPKVSGREVLDKIKNDSELLGVPVVILTTSNASEDIARSYDLHANCYITKPVDFSRFTTVVQAINSFWFNTVTLPPVNT